MVWALVSMTFGANGSDGAGLSLETAVSEALAKNPDLKRSQYAVDGANWKALEALSGYMPHLSAGANQVLSVKYVTPKIKFSSLAPASDFPNQFADTDIDLDASITVFDGLESLNMFRAAILSRDAAKLEYRYGKFRLSANVKARYYEALGAVELAKVADQNIATLEQHLALVRLGEQAGTGTRVDVLRIESQLEEARAEKILDEDNVVLARKALAETMGRESDLRPLTGSLPTPENGAVGSNLVLELKGREDIQAVSLRKQAQAAVNAASLSFLLPRVSFFFREEFYKYGNETTIIQSNDTLQDAYNFGVKFTWNIFDGGASLARKGQADAAYRQASETYRKASLGAPNEFENWKRKYAFNTALFRARQRSVERSEESVRLATLAVKAGSKTHSEVLDAELDLFRTRAGLIRAQLDALESLLSIELALGHPI